MTVETIMSFRLEKLKPTDTVRDALRVMHTHQVRNLAVVDENNRFVGLFGIRRLIHLLLPKAAQMDFGLRDLSFMPDQLGELYNRLEDVGKRPVAEFLEKKKNLVFCKPSTSFLEVLKLLDQSAKNSLPLIVIKGKKRKLVGLVSAWDVLEKLVINGHTTGGVKDQNAATDDEANETGIKE